MTKIKKVGDHDVIDYMARDYDSLLLSMREIIPEKLPEWIDYESEADFGNVLLQVFAHMGDILSYYQDRIANESFLGTARTRRSIIHHLGLISYRLSTAAPSSTTVTLTVPADKNDLITIVKGNAFATKSQKDKPVVRFEYTAEETLRIDCSALPENNGKKYFKGIPVEEGRLVLNEVLGVSDGRPNQKYPLIHKNLILRSLGIGSQINKDLIILSRLGDTTEEWVLQESLVFSREGQRDYIIEINENDQASIIFGDGAFGAIPKNGAEIRATYRVGGGELGNVPQNTIETIVDAPQLTLLGAKITNPKPASGGSDRESINHAVKHAPNVFRSFKRSVTAEDYKALAMNFNGVGKLRAEATNWNTVTLFVAPEGGGTVSDIFRANLLAYFEDKRPLSTIIEIEDADYVKIYIKAEVGIESYYSPENIKEKVSGAVANLLAFKKVDFEDTLYLSKFYEAIEDIEGVKYVTIKRFTREADLENHIDENGIIAMGVNEIPRIPNDSDDDQEYARGIFIEELTTTGGI
ncbi:MAG: baseplate J/gp47 family protein [Desulfocapsa sp.]|nr:baseplate J/gp47 family protein [Desulfocapsa sp.]